MLVLSLKPRERVQVKTPGGDIFFRITEICGSHRVRVGVTAPVEFLILREDLIRDKEEVKQ